MHRQGRQVLQSGRCGIRRGASHEEHAAMVELLHGDCCEERFSLGCSIIEALYKREPTLASLACFCIGHDAESTVRPGETHGPKSFCHDHETRSWYRTWSVASGCSATTACSKCRGAPPGCQRLWPAHSKHPASRHCPSRNLEMQGIPQLRLVSSSASSAPQSIEDPSSQRGLPHPTAVAAAVLPKNPTMADASKHRPFNIAGVLGTS